jgi:hypothetical protein
VFLRALGHRRQARRIKISIEQQHTILLRHRRAVESYAMERRARVNTEDRLKLRELLLRVWFFYFTQHMFSDHRRPQRVAIQMQDPHRLLDYITALQWSRRAANNCAEQTTARQHALPKV